MILAAAACLLYACYRRSNKKPVAHLYISVVSRTIWTTYATMYACLLLVKASPIESWGLYAFTCTVGQTQISVCNDVVVVVVVVIPCWYYGPLCMITQTWRKDSRACCYRRRCYPANWGIFFYSPKRLVSKILVRGWCQSIYKLRNAKIPTCYQFFSQYDVGREKHWSYMCLMICIMFFERILLQQISNSQALSWP